VSGRPALAAGVLAAIAWLAGVAIVVAASPAPSAAAGGDPRSSGQGPGLVGDPAFAVLAVVAIGVCAVGLTLVYLRLTGPRGG
jgi:hypothetical protein